MHKNCLVGGLLAWVLACASCATPKPALTRFEFEQPQMGLPFRIVLYAPTESQATHAAQAAYDRIKQLNSILSDYEDDSELTRLSQTAGQGQAVKVSLDLWHVLQRAQWLAEHSEGAFDVTVGPYVSLWRRARRIHQLPEPDKLAAARLAVGYDKLRLNPQTHTVELLVPKMRLDLGGIAKGYAVDEALKVLSARGIKSALVAGSGDMAASEPPPGKPGWRIEIAAHEATNAPPRQFVWLRHYALATSGDVYQYVEIAGKRYSHLVDPRTGIGLTDRCLVTVIAPHCMTADSLTKVVCVAGPAKGFPLVEATPGAAALSTRQHGDALEQRQTKDWAKHRVD